MIHSFEKRLLANSFRFGSGFLTDTIIFLRRCFWCRNEGPPQFWTAVKCNKAHLEYPLETELMNLFIFKIVQVSKSNGLFSCSTSVVDRFCSTISS